MKDPDRRSPTPPATAMPAPLTGGVQWVAQETGGALEFDGSSGYVRIPFSESLRVLNKGGLTIMAWFKADAIATENKEVFQQGDANGTGRTWLYITNVGQIQTYLGGAAVASGVNVTAGTWCHAAIVITEAGATDTIQIYVNGKPVGTAVQRGMENSEGPYFIGCHKNMTNYWDGLIDDVRLYNRALSADEIKAMVPPKVKAMNPDPAREAPPWSLLCFAGLRARLPYCITCMSARTPTWAKRTSFSPACPWPCTFTCRA